MRYNVKTKRKPKKRTDPAWRARAAGALAAEPELRRRLAEAGLRLRLSTVTAGRTQFPHWRVYDGPTVVLHIWPASLTYWRPDGGIRGRLAGIEDLLALVGAGAPLHNPPER
jgi:hypothetical protein